MAPVKRARVAAVSSEAKKAKVVDPVTEKIDLVTSTVRECAMASESHREMLLSSIPHTLTVSCDERHAYQTQVAEMVGIVLKEHVAAWEKTVEEHQGNICLTAEKESQHIKAVEESVGKITAQEDEVTKLKDQLDEDSKAATTAEEAFQAAVQEVAEFDDKLLETKSRKEECASVFDLCFIPLKEGTAEASGIKGLLKQVETMLKKLKIESSLLSALKPALNKIHSERGPFDIIAVEGAEGLFSKNLGEMQEHIEKADDLRAEKLATESTAKVALDDAVEKRTSSEVTLKSAQDELSALETSHQEIYKTADLAGVDAWGAKEKHATKEEGLKLARKVLETFTELLERKAVPEPEVSSVAMDEKLSATNEDTLMEPVSVV